MERYPFEFTAQIVRYLETIIKAYAKRQMGSPKDTKFTLLIVDNVLTYEEDEQIMSYSEKNRKLFEEFLKTRGTRIRSGIKTETEYGVISDSGQNKDSQQFIQYPKTIFFQIPDIEPLLKAWRYYNEHKRTDLLKPLHYWDSSDMRFDKENRRITYFKKIHTLQKNRKRTYLFELLWQNRDHTYNGKSISNGKPLSFTEIISEVGYRKENQLVSDLKNMDATLRAKKFPLKISHKGKKALLSINEKV